VSPRAHSVGVALPRVVGGEAAADDAEAAAAVAGAVAVARGGGGDLGATAAPIAREVGAPPPARFGALVEKEGRLFALQRKRALAEVARDDVVYNDWLP